MSGEDFTETCRQAARELLAEVGESWSDMQARFDCECGCMNPGGLTSEQSLALVELNSFLHYAGEPWLQEGAPAPEWLGLQ